MRDILAALVNRISFFVYRGVIPSTLLYKSKKWMLDVLRIGCYNHHIKII